MFVLTLGKKSLRRLGAAAVCGIAFYLNRSAGL